MQDDPTSRTVKWRRLDLNVPRPLNVSHPQGTLRFWAGCTANLDAVSSLGQSRSAAATIASFLNLPDGWQYGEGRGATEAAHDTALRIDGLLLRTAARVIEAFPYLDGGILVCGRYKNQDVEVSCAPDGRTLSLCHAIDDEPRYEEDDCNLAFITNYIKELPWSLKSFDYSTPVTIVQIEAGTRARRFPVQARMGELPASALNVPDKKAEVSANTSWRTITPVCPAINQSFGASV